MTTSSLHEKSSHSNSCTKEIAYTILHQIGGRRFIAMTGAKNFVALIENKTKLGGISFSIPAKLSKNKINRVVISLMPNDTYQMEFFRVFGITIKPIETYSDVYCDQLSSLFTDVTGMDVHL